MKLTRLSRVCLSSFLICPLLFCFPAPIFQLPADSNLVNAGSLGGAVEWRNPVDGEGARFAAGNAGIVLDFMATAKDLKPGSDKRGGALLWNPANMSKNTDGLTLILRYQTKETPPNARLFTSPLFNLMPYPVLYVTASGAQKNLNIENAPNAISGIWWAVVVIRFSEGQADLSIISDKDRKIRFKNSMTVGKIDPALFRGPFEIGNYQGIRPFRGLIDKVLLFDTPLSETDIDSLLTPPLTNPSGPSGFIPLFRTPSPSEKIFIEPSVWGSIRQDEFFGPSILFRVRPPGFRRTYSFPSQLPHMGIQFKARSSGPDTDVAFEVRGMAVSSGKIRNVLLKSRSIRLNKTPQNLRLMYAEDFEPAHDAAEFVGESIQAIVVTAAPSEETDLIFTAIRAVNAKSAPAVEIRRFLHERHVFTEKEGSELSLEVFSSMPGAAKFRVQIERQDGKISRRFEQTTDLRGGEEIIHLRMDGLPRGYFSVGVEVEMGSARHSSGSHTVIVPKGSPEPWLGVHDSGVDLTTLKDHRLAGYGWLRFTEAALFLRVDVRKDFDLVDSLIAPRAQLGFQILFTFLALPRPKVDWDYLDRKVKEFGIKTDVPILRLTADPCYPVEDHTWMKDMLAFLSKNLKGKVTHYEFGNEFDRIIFPGARFDSGKREFDWWGTPEEYAVDLIQFSDGVKNGNPDAKILNAGVTCGLWTPGRETFVPRMLDAGGQKGLDIFAVHGYGGYDNVQRVLGDLKKRGIQKPWGNTERGVGSQDLAAHRLALEEILKSKRDGAVFYTTFFPERIDYLADPVTGRHGPYKQPLSEFTTMLPDGAPGMKFAMEAALAHLLSHAQNIRLEENAGVTEWKWSGDAGQVVLAYAEKSGSKETYLSTSAITRIDLYGNAEESSAREQTVDIGPMPVYLISANAIRSSRDESLLSAAGPRAVIKEGKPALEYLLHKPATSLGLRLSTGAALSPILKQIAAGSVVLPLLSPTSSFNNELELFSDGKFLRSGLSWALGAPSVSDKPDWSKVSFFEMNRAAQITTGRVLWQGLTDYNIYKGTVFGVSNISARLGFATFGKTIFFRFEIMDDEICEGDECELVFLEPRTGAKFTARPVGANPVIASTFQGLRIEILRQPSGYVVSGSFPQDQALSSGSAARFEFTIRDADSHADAGKKPYLEMKSGAGDGVILWH